MWCKSCSSTLHYHTAGITCRNCGFSVDHEFLSEVICRSCHNRLDESEDNRDLCILSIRSSQTIIGEYALIARSWSRGVAQLLLAAGIIAGPLFIGVSLLLWAGSFVNCY